MTDTPEVRPAATIVLWRRHGGEAQVLMGQRGAAAVFMPSKYVFPGGGVDMGDAGIAFARPLSALCTQRLSGEVTPQTLAAAAIRELYEETGLALGRSAVWPDAPQAWQGFAARGLLPDAGALRFIFRAITPPGRTRRFDARFFLADANAVAGDTEDFSAAQDELSHLHWIGLAQARALDLPFITEVVLSEVGQILNGGPDEGVPFFDNSGPVPTFRRL